MTYYYVNFQRIWNMFKIVDLYFKCGLFLNGWPLSTIENFYCFLPLINFVGLFKIMYYRAMEFFEIQTDWNIGHFLGNIRCFLKIVDFLRPLILFLFGRFIFWKMWTFFEKLKMFFEIAVSKIAHLKRMNFFEKLWNILKMGSFARGRNI